MMPFRCRIAASAPAFLIAASLATAFAAPSEVTVHVRNHDQDPIVMLNRFTFMGNVLEGLGDPAQNWVVFFTSLSDPQAVQLVPSFRVLAGDMANQLNTGRWFSSFAKFAVVDCNVEQDLCREQSVEHLPSIVHYRDGVQLSHWRSKTGVGMLPWLRSQLMGGSLAAKMRREEPPQVVSANTAETSPKQQPAASIADAVAAAVASAPSPSGDGGEGGEEAGEDACHADDEADDFAGDELHHEGMGSQGFIQRLQQATFPPALTLSLMLGVLGASFWIVLQGVVLEP
mmetsp:Transcript_126132/g.315239  ORF Transcript_126132/g.315239 Transcript_126132/m.315239 type:complete len:286 (+) Transcript_126132:106-963(+)